MSEGGQKVKRRGGEIPYAGNGFPHIYREVGLCPWPLVWKAWMCLLPH